MSLILFAFLPLAWALTGFLLGRAVSACVPGERGQRSGRALGRWSAWALPAVYLLLFFLGGGGDAGHGIRLFGSEELFAILCVPVYAVPALGLFLGAACVIRDVARGLRSGGS
jgi:hypothetical protein